jgi:RHS repeat-associated protein
LWKIITPFGLQLSGQSFTNTTLLNKYLFNGKEKQDQTGMYDYGFRQLDPVLGCWHGADKLAEKHPAESPYSYCGGDPVNRVDVAGLSWWSHFTGWLGEHPVVAAVGAELLTGGAVSCTAIATGLTLSTSIAATSVTAQATLSSIDYTSACFMSDPQKAGERFGNALSIDFGMFRYDESYSGKGDFWRDTWQILSRFTTLENVQTSLGNAYSHYLNATEQVEGIYNFHGATVLDVKHMKPGTDGKNIGGSYIKVLSYDEIPYDQGIWTESARSLIHEYGHYRQGRINGFLGYEVIGINSFFHPLKSDSKAWAERDASYEGYLYMRQYYNMQGYTEYGNQHLDYLPLLYFIIGL